MKYKKFSLRKTGRQILLNHFATKTIDKICKERENLVRCDNLTLKNRGKL